MYEMIVEILESMGCFIVEKGSDFDVRDYILDSLQFMEFIVGIEEKLGIELGEDFLNYELLISAAALANKIESYLEEQKQSGTIPPDVMIECDGTIR